MTESRSRPKRVPKRIYRDERQLWRKFGYDLLLVSALWIGAEIIWHWLPAMERTCSRVDQTVLTEQLRQACLILSDEVNRFRWWAEVYFYFAILLYMIVSWVLFLRIFALNVTVFISPPTGRITERLSRYGLTVGALIAVTVLPLHGYQVHGGYEEQVLAIFHSTRAFWSLFGWLIMTNYILMTVWIVWRYQHYNALLTAQRGERPSIDLSFFSSISLIVLTGIVSLIFH